MDKILIICYRCAGFELDGEKFFITPANLGVFVEAPAWIEKTYMFSLLVKDGSLKVADKHISKKEGENDPMKGITAEGKEEKPEKPEEDKIIKPRKTTRSKKAE